MLKRNFKRKAIQRKIVSHLEIIEVFLLHDTEYDTFVIFFINQRSTGNISRSKVFKRSSIIL